MSDTFPNENQSDNFSDNQSDNLRGRLGDILRMINEGRTQNYIQKVTGIKKSNLSRQIAILLKKKLIRKIARGVYETKVITSNKAVLQSDNLKYYRFHKLQVELPVSSDIFKVIKSHVFSNKQYFNIRSFGKVGYYFDCEVIGLLTVKNKLFMMFPEDWEVNFKSVEEGMQGIYDIIRQVCEKWHNRFKIDFFKPGKLNFIISDLHIAYIENGLSKELKSRNVKGVSVYDDDDGKPRFVIDWSKGMPEVEFMHPEQQISDAQTWQKFCLNLKSGKIDKLMEFEEGQKEVIKDLIKLHIINEQRWESHYNFITTSTQKQSDNNEKESEMNKEKPTYIG